MNSLDIGGKKYRSNNPDIFHKHFGKERAHIKPNVTVVVLNQIKSNGDHNLVFNSFICYSLGTSNHILQLS